MKPTGGEGERQAGATPIFPKKTEEPIFLCGVLATPQAWNHQVLLQSKKDWPDGFPADDALVPCIFLLFREKSRKVKFYGHKIFVLFQVIKIYIYILKY